METRQRPTKEQVREWLASRRQSHAPLPNAEHIRHELGWEQVDRTCAEPRIQQAA